MLESSLVADLEGDLHESIQAENRKGLSRMRIGRRKIAEVGMVCALELSADVEVLSHLPEGAASTAG